MEIKIYGWADNYIKKPTEGQIMLVNRELLQMERCYGVAKEFFALLSELETIKVVDTEFQETDLIELSELVSQLPSRQIQKVIFSRCTFSENAPLRQSFGALGNCQRIEEIAFDGCNLSDADLPELKNLWLLVPTLKILRLTRNDRITGEYYLRDFIIDICNSALSLKMLDLSRNGIDDSITSALHESIWIPSLSQKLPNLNLSYNSISVRESKTIFKLHQSSGSPTELSLLPYTPESYVLVEKTSSIRSDLLAARPSPPKLQITSPAAAPPQTASLSAEESALEGLLASNPSATPRWLLTSLGDVLQHPTTDTRQVVTVNHSVASIVRDYVKTQLLSPPTLSWREFSAVLAIAKLLVLCFCVSERYSHNTNTFTGR